MRSLVPNLMKKFFITCPNCKMLVANGLEEYFPIVKTCARTYSRRIEIHMQIFGSNQDVQHGAKNW